MSSLNKVMLIGNLGRDPEVRNFQNGGKVCNLRIATSETWKDRNTGERKEKTEWHSVAIFAEPVVNIAEKYLRKGSKVYIEGQLETRKWQDQQGNDQYSTEIVVRPYKGELTLLDARNAGQQQDNASNGGDQYGYEQPGNNGNGQGTQGGYDRNGYGQSQGVPSNGQGNGGYGQQPSQGSGFGGPSGQGNGQQQGNQGQGFRQPPANGGFGGPQGGQQSGPSDGFR